MVNGGDATFMKVLVLASGGLDSTACIRYYLNKSFDVKALHVAYGQKSEKRERHAVIGVCAKLGVPLHIVRVTNFNTPMSGEVTGRNAFLLSAALMVLQRDAGLVSIGIHAGTPYVDCAAEFVVTMQRIFDLYSDGRVRIDAPFLAWTKGEVYESLRSDDVAGLTYSCELGLNQPCGRCVTCDDLRSLGC